MIKVYEIKSNGYIGATKEIDPREGVMSNWTHTAPPAEGCYRWEAGTWVAGIEPIGSHTSVDTQQAADSTRAERNRRLAETDWTQSRDVADEIAAKWAPYRQALRAIPEQSSFPLFVEWPDKPE